MTVRLIRRIRSSARKGKVPTHSFCRLEKEPEFSKETLKHVSTPFGAGSFPGPMHVVVLALASGLDSLTGRSPEPRGSCGFETCSRAYALPATARAWPSTDHSGTNSSLSSDPGGFSPEPISAHIASRLIYDPNSKPRSFKGRYMDATLMAFFATLLLSVFAGLLSVRRTARQRAWLDKIESQRERKDVYSTPRH
jgi:hypothetical protein